MLDRLTPVVLFVFLLVSYSLKISAQAPSAGIYAKLSESSSLLADTVSEAFTTGNNVFDIIVLTRPDLGKLPICYAGQLNESDQVANALF